VLRQERAREHRTALHSRPSSAARGARPAQDPGGHHHHAGPSQPRRHCALSSTAKPATRPPTCGCSTAPHHHVQSRVQKQKALSRAEHWSSPRAPQAQDKAPRQDGNKTASRTARNKRKQPAFANKSDAHRACRCGGGIAERDERLAVFVIQNNMHNGKVQGGGRSQGKERNAASPASQAHQGGQQATARASTTSEFTGPRCGHGSRAPCSVWARPVATPDKTKRPCGSYLIWNCTVYIWIKL